MQLVLLVLSSASVLLPSLPSSDNDDEIRQVKRLVFRLVGRRLLPTQTRLPSRSHECGSLAIDHLQIVVCGVEDRVLAQGGDRASVVCYMATGIHGAVT